MKRALSLRRACRFDCRQAEIRRGMTDAYKNQTEHDSYKPAPIVAAKITFVLLRRALRIVRFLPCSAKLFCG